MDRINRAIQATNDLERMMSEVLKEALEIFACDRAWLIHPCDPEASSWHAVMEHTKPEYPGAFMEKGEQPVDDEIAAVFSAARARGRCRAVWPGLSATVAVARHGAFRHPVADRDGARRESWCSRTSSDCISARTRRVWTLDERRLFEEIGRRFGDALTSLRCSAAFAKASASWKRRSASPSSVGGNATT